MCNRADRKLSSTRLPGAGGVGEVAWGEGVCPRGTRQSKEKMKRLKCINFLAPVRPTRHFQVGTNQKKRKRAKHLDH